MYMTAEGPPEDLNACIVPGNQTKPRKAMMGGYTADHLAKCFGMRDILDYVKGKQIRNAGQCDLFRLQSSLSQSISQSVNSLIFVCSCLPLANSTVDLRSCGPVALHA